MSMLKMMAKLALSIIISAHTGHDLGPQELKYLPLPSSTKQEVSMKISMGITAERILSGTYMTV